MVIPCLIPYKGLHIIRKGGKGDIKENYKVLVG